MMEQLSAHRPHSSYHLTKETKESAKVSNTHTYRDLQFLKLPSVRHTHKEAKGREMEEAKGVVKHVLLAKFKEGIPADEIDKLIKGYANLVNLIEPMKAFHWGTDVSIENMHQGFTHVFESTFESTEGIAEYVAHPAHVEFANLFLPALDKVIVIDYKPTIVRQ